MATGLYSGVSGLAIGVGLNKGVTGLWSGASGLIAGWGGGFNPLSLFASGEQGAWYDPSDLTTMFQDTAGTTPVTATGQTVGLLLDKSKGLVLGPELVTNGDFSSATGWTLGTGWSISGGQASRTAEATGTTLGQNNVLQVGRTYQVTFTITAVSGTLRIIAGSSSVGISRTAPGTYTQLIVADGTVLNVQAFTGTTGTIDNISVKELPGNHATQATAASRPIYGIEPFGGRRNLLSWTEQFDNAYWVKNNATVTANTAMAPDGTITADALVWAASTNPQLTPAAVTIAAGTPVTLTVYAKAGTKSSITLILFNDGSNFALASFNLTNGTAGTPSATGIRFTSLSTSTVDAGNGWYRCTLSASTNTLTSVASWLRADTATASGDNILIWGAQLETGSTATAYQRVTDQWNVTQAGVPSVAYLAFDGTDDWMLTGTITPGTDKAQVFAGVRKLSDAAVGMVVESSTTVDTNDGTLNLFGRGAAGFECRSKGTIVSPASVAGAAAPRTDVLSVLGDISGDRTTLRVNGTQVAQSTTDQGTGNYLAYPLYIGRRGGTTLPYNGRIYQMLVRFGANLSAATITQTETFVNSRTGAY